MTKKRQKNDKKNDRRNWNDKKNDKQMTNKMTDKTEMTKKRQKNDKKKWQTQLKWQKNDKKRQKHDKINIWTISRVWLRVSSNDGSSMGFSNASYGISACWNPGRIGQVRNFNAILRTMRTSSGLTIQDKNAQTCWLIICLWSWHNMLQFHWMVGWVGLQCACYSRAREVCKFW